MGKMLVRLNVDEVVTKRNELLNYLEEICVVSKETNDCNTIIGRVKEYWNDTHRLDKENVLSGRVWVLYKRNININDECIEVLQVAQALDKTFSTGFFKEITSHIREMVHDTNPKKKGKYFEMYEKLQDCEELVFAELNIDQYLDKNISNIKDIIYNASKRYFAEALVAYFTDASEWTFYNSGMDFRAYSIFSKLIPPKIKDTKDVEKI